LKSDPKNSIAWKDENAVPRIPAAIFFIHKWQPLPAKEEHKHIYQEGIAAFNRFLFSKRDTADSSIIG
jgi:hypothetical protein